MAPLSGELSSWKEIAAYLGVSVKTAQLWEKDRGLPIHRPVGPGGQVRAFTAELDAWRTSGSATAAAPVQAEISEPAAEEPQRRATRWGSRWLLVAAALVVGVLVGVGGVRSFRPRLASVRVDPDALVGLDSRGATLWRATFGHPLRMDGYLRGETTAALTDLDGDGASEVLFIPVPPGSGQPAPVVCLDDKGRELWRFTPGKAVTLKGVVYAPPYVARQFAVLNGRVIVTSHHHVFHPSQVAVLDSKGGLVREYWHPGHLNALTAVKYRGRDVVLLGGVNNDEHRATMVALNPDTLAGSAVEDGVPAFKGMAAGVEEARLLFPRSCLNKNDPYNVAMTLISDDQHGITVDVREQLNELDPASIQYHLTHDLTLARVTPSDMFLSKHAHQRAAGILDHAWSEGELAGLRTLESAR